MLAHFVETFPAVFESSTDPVWVSDRQIQELIKAATQAPTGRSRLLLHPDRNDLLQEMVIALPPSSCDHPHINYKSGKSFLALSGQFALMHFSDDGSRITAYVLSAGAWPGGRMVRLRSPAWHTIIPLAGNTVFLETIIGPFKGNRFAEWFPSTGIERIAFIGRLQSIAASAAQAYSST